VRRLIRGFLAAVVLFGGAFNFVPARAVSAATPCVGDCDGSGQVTVEDILTMVDIALGSAPLSACSAGDQNGDLLITVDEILVAVNNALNGCSSARQPVTAVPPVVSTTTNSLGAVDFGCVYAAGCALPTPMTSGAGWQPRFRLAGSARVAIADAGSQADACPTVTCTVAGETSTLTTTYAGCQTVTAGHTIVRNGTVTQSVTDASFCDTRTIPADATSTLILSGFTLTETDSSGAPLASIMATITETFGPTGAQCGTLASGTETIDGSESFACAPGAQTVDCPAAGADLTLTAQNLVLQRTTNNGVPCTLTVTAQGELDIQNALTGERFDETFAQTQFAESTTIGGDGTTLSVEGSLTVGCLGSLDLQTPRPIVMAAEATCPSGGVLQVAQPVPGEAPTSSTAQRADAVAAMQATVPTFAEPVNTIDLNDGFRQGVFRAANGQVYQVLQNVSAGADLGAEAFQVSSVVGSAGVVGAYSQEPSIGYSGLTAVAVVGGQAIRSDLILKSPVIQQDVSQPPCFSSAGDGSVCVGKDCATDCGCPSGGACDTFSVGEGTPITTSTDTPAALFVGALQTAIQNLDGGATYAFGPSGPTTEADTCQPAPADGFALGAGNSIIFAYETPLATRFTVGYAGFPVDQDGQNPFGCPAGTLVGAGPAIAHLTLPPPMIEFTAQGGIAFDFNQDGLVDSTVATCQQTVAQCVAATPLPTTTPTPAPPSPTPTPTGTPPPPPPTVTGTPPMLTPTGTPAPTGTPLPTSTPTVSLPDLIITQLIAGVSPALPGQTMPVTVTVGNQGNADAGPFAVTFVFSTDMTISADDPRSTVTCQFAGLAAQATATCSQLVTITATLPPGTYFLGAIADASGQVVESDKSNNTRLANTATPAQQPLSFGQTLAGAISAALQANTYTFSASGGDVVLLAITATSGTLVPEIKVFGSGPNPVCSAAPGLCEGSTVEITDCALPATGTYTVLVDDCGGNTQTGNYSLYLQRLNQPGGASALVPGQTLSATIFAAAEKDTYTFWTSAGGLVDIKMATTSGALAPNISVYSPAGAVVCAATSFLCEYSTVDLGNCSLPDAGTYAIIVGDCGDTQTGGYDLNLTCITAPCLPATPAPTNARTPTPTSTPTSPSTPTPTQTATLTQTPTVTLTPMPTATPTPSPTVTPTGTRCVVGTGMGASCTESALTSCLAGGGSVTFNCGGATTITVTTTKAISADATIDGGSLITISGRNSVGVFSVSAGVNFTVQNLTIANGGTWPYGGTTLYGGGILNAAGTLTVTNSTFSGNSAVFGGGGIYSGGPLTVTNSTFSGNSTRGDDSSPGGGIWCYYGGTVTNSTFSGNEAVYGGGGIYNNAGTLTVTNSTFSGNSGDLGAGGIDNSGTLTVTNSTFSGNSADQGSGGGPLTVTNSIFSDNSAVHGSNCSGTITDGGHNIDDGTTCGFTGPGCTGTGGSSFCNTNPLLDPVGLANNGGPTQTIAIEPTSPAVNAGDESVCAAPPVNNLDQRGYVRPGRGAANCSIGAFEANAAPAPPTVTFAHRKAFAVGSSPRSVAVADLNGDGLPDVVSANFEGNAVVRALALAPTGPPALYAGTDGGVYAIQP
jgi:hypothetical protein